MTHKISHNAQIAIILGLSVVFVFLGSVFINSYFTGAAISTPEWWISWDAKYDSKKTYEISIEDSINLYSAYGNSLHVENAKVLMLKTLSQGAGLRLSLAKCKNSKNEYRSTNAIYLYAETQPDSTSQIAVYYQDNKLNKAAYCNTFKGNTHNLAEFLTSKIKAYVDIVDYEIAEEKDVEIGNSDAKVLYFKLKIDAPSEDIYLNIRTEESCGRAFCYLGNSYSAADVQELLVESRGFGHEGRYRYGQNLVLESISTLATNYNTIDGIRIYDIKRYLKNDRVLFGVPA